MGRQNWKIFLKHGTIIATPNLTISCPTFEIVAEKPPSIMYAEKNNNGLNLTLTSKLHPAILVISPTTLSMDVALQMNQAMKMCDKKCWSTQTTNLIVCEASDLTYLKHDSDTFEELSSGAHLFLHRNFGTNIG